MCTVTYIPYNDKIYITSNRDESTARPPATMPVIHEVSSGKILFPKDGKHNGTWVGIHNNGNAMVLMNGAFGPHIRKAEYRMSRGLIFLDIFNSPNPVKKFNETNLEDIEPFTLIAWMKHNGTLWEMRWDEYERFVTSLDANVPHLWASATLYDPKTIEERRELFSSWLSKQEEITGDNIRSFHNYENENTDLPKLNTDKYSIVTTQSITGIEILQDRSVMYHHDLLTDEQTINGWMFADNSEISEE